MPKYLKVKGTEDVIPPESSRRRWVEERMTRLFALYGYREIRTPMFETSELFSRSLGEKSEVVTKEMYTFSDRGERSLTLRPEGTAPVMRALIENAMLRPKSMTRTYYLGPMFRYERPQKGRSRQFYQYGIEAVGSQNPAVDSEVIVMAARLLDALGISGYKILLNSIGCSLCRPAYVTALKNFVEAHMDSFCPQCKTRAEHNPLRVLDCKVSDCQKALSDAPVMANTLCEPCREHFQKVRGFLDAYELSYEMAPRLVRGLDYYMRTTFEFIHEKDLGAQNALLGGGRYDGLVKELGGPDLPGVGFAGGMERLMLTLPKDSVPDKPLDFFIATMGEEAFRKGLLLAARLRKKNYSADMDFEGRSLKAQLREANRIGARNSLILGEDEIREKVVVMKVMASHGTQETLTFEQLFELLQRREEVL